LWFLTVGQFINAAGSFVFVYLFVYLVDPRGLSLSEAGLVSGIAGAGAIAGNFTGGWFGDRYGHRTVLPISAVQGLSSAIGIVNFWAERCNDISTSCGLSSCEASVALPATRQRSRLARRLLQVQSAGSG